MVADTPDKQQTPLLGLRPPADLAEEAVAPLQRSSPARQAPAAAPVAAPATPPRPSYPVISSGWDSEDEETGRKSSDMVAALRAGLVLLVIIIALAWLLR